ncbi:MAG TPA: hypothetical protein VJA21_17190 [Verrucomicrobiae bacterium]
MLRKSTSIRAFVVISVCFAAAGRASELRPLIQDFIGLNGHTVQFRPELFAPVCRLARDYHPVEWDLGTNTTEMPPWPLAKNGVDWSKVYGSWRNHGWGIDVSLMFETVPLAGWANLQRDARTYGEAFAREFGPSGKRKLVSSVEIGNEPGKRSDAEYGHVFKAIAEGIRTGDPQMRICSCNLTTGKSGDYEKSAQSLVRFTNLLDVLTIHTYAQLEGWPSWRRTFPEDPRLPRYLQDVEALCRWRDNYTADKPVWITEFGYDSSTKRPAPAGDFARWTGVSDAQQAQWLVRSLLVFSAMPVERAYIYFFNDEDQAQVHASSGLTRHFQPKPSFYAVAHLQRVLGECRFKQVLTNQPAPVRVQEYQKDSGEVVWTVWSPTGNGTEINTTLGNLPGKLLRAERMPLDAADPVVPIQPDSSGRIQISVQESPLYLLFEKR